MPLSNAALPRVGEAATPRPAPAPVLRLPNVALTPSVAGAFVRTVRVAAEEVRRFVAGQLLLNPC